MDARQLRIGILLVLFQVLIEELIQLSLCVLPKGRPFATSLADYSLSTSTNLMFGNSMPD